MKRPCGCYEDQAGRVFARCPVHNGNAVKSMMERKLAIQSARAADNARRREWRAKFKDGKTCNHRQSEGGP